MFTIAIRGFLTQGNQITEINNQRKWNKGRTGKILPLFFRVKDNLQQLSMANLYKTKFPIYSNLHFNLCQYLALSVIYMVYIHELMIHKLGSLHEYKYSWNTGHLMLKAVLVLFPLPRNPTPKGEQLVVKG